MSEYITSRHVLKVASGKTLINGEYHTFSTFTKITFYDLMYERKYDTERRLWTYHYIHNGALKWHAVPLTNLSEEEKKDLLCLANRDPNGSGQEQRAEELEGRVIRFERKAA